ncbi:MAG: Copper binding protein plastocyanin/azurin family [Actinomycetota bacterium]|nr:Copper binding protein plastocyanin/azurin family [Actinomycetota bacterium]
MTTTDEQPTDDSAAQAEAEPVPAVEATATLATPEDGDAAGAHPYRERFVVPFVFPLLIVVGIVFFVLNISRIFLANKGTAAIIIAAAITVLILFGAAALSAAPNLRTSSLALVVVGALVVISAAGWLTVGHAEEKKSAAIVLGPSVGKAEIEALPTLRFQPDKVSVPFDPAHPTETVVEFDLKDAIAGQHTLTFDDPTVVWTTLVVNNAGEVKSEKAGFPKAGDYAFHCAVPGHKEAGMVGTVTVTPTLKPQASAAASGAPTTAAP